MAGTKYQSVNLNDALKNLQGAVNLEEKQLVDDVDQKSFLQLQTEHLINWLKATIDKTDNDRPKKTKERLNALNNRVIDFYDGHSTLNKKADEKAVPIKKREELVRTKISLLAYACNNIKLLTIPALLESIRLQIIAEVIVIKPTHSRSQPITNLEEPIIPLAETNLALAVPSFKQQVISIYQGMLAAYEKNKIHNPKFLEVISLLHTELLKLDPPSSALNGSLAFPAAQNFQVTTAAATTAATEMKYLVPK